jgi:hypothetical protein
MRVEIPVVNERERQTYSGILLSEGQKRENLVEFKKISTPSKT